MPSFHLFAHLGLFLLCEAKRTWTIDPLDIQLTYLYLLQWYDYTGTSSHAERNFFWGEKVSKNGYRYATDKTIFKKRRKELRTAANNTFDCVEWCKPLMSVRLTNIKRAQPLVWLTLITTGHQTWWSYSLASRRAIQFSCINPHPTTCSLCIH